MSRCFPYPPPGYERTGAHDEALIESIKRERELARKEKRKEKKRERKEKKESKKKVEDQKKSHKDDKKQKEEKNQGDEKYGEYQKRIGNRTEQLEKSSISEEHGQPVKSHKKHCGSTDSTQNSNKRQKCDTSLNEKNNGSIIWIHFPPEKQKEAEAQSHTVSEVSPTPNKQTRDKPNSNSHITCQNSASRDYRNSPFPSKVPEISRVDACAPTSSSHPVELQLQDLFVNWVPHQTSEPTDSDDLDWLLNTKRNHNHNHSRRAKCLEYKNVFSVFNSSSPWSQAYHLPDVDIYALPFTIPF